MITQLEHPKTEHPPANAMGFTLTGTLHDEDYKKLVPMVDEAIARHGPTRLLVRLHDFDGWDARAAIDDLKFAVNHYRDIERIALVGEKNWHELLAMIAGPFTAARIRFFGPDELDVAWNWLDEES